jgi:hypothetical protein
MGVPEHLIILIKNLYTNQEARVKTEHGSTDCYEVGKGVRQGCILSPCLFNMYSECIMRRIGLECGEGIKIGGRTINNLRYADDTTLITGDKDDMRRLLTKLMEESEKAGLTLNLKKTKIMTTGEFALGGTKVELTDCYIFLGSIISRGGSDSKEINQRLSMGRVAMAKLEKIFKDSDIRIGAKIKIVETLVFPVVTYGSESWTVRKSDRKRIDAFELWTWRRMLRIPWTAKRTNLSVVEEVKPKRALEVTILRQKL